MSSFDTHTDARQFFVERILQEAHVQGVPLSDDERQMLLWSETADDSVADPALAERLATEISDADYEAKIARLLRSRFTREMASDPEARRVWIAARSVLGRGDHYITVMIDRAVGRQLRPWWRIW